jgi:putative spermidine/putrescine transport system ATP-binding protein
MNSGPVLELCCVSKVYAGAAVVSDLSLAIMEGEFLSIIGPSGCGKSTILKMLVGAVEPTSGRILLRGTNLSRLPRDRLNVVMVWQSLALFPHMTVGENVAFGLTMRRVSPLTIAERVAQALDMVDLPATEGRRIGQLSGGELQRVALARALVIEPRVLLLDEPLGGLDRHRRAAMLAKFRDIHRRTGVTVVMVTHDQAEAMTTSSRIAVLNRGRIEQVGLPAEVDRQPRTAFVARFVGHKNVFPATVVAAQGGRVTVMTAAGELQATRPAWTDSPCGEGSPVAYVVDAHRVEIGMYGGNRVAGTLDTRALSGAREMLEVVVPGLGVVRCDRIATDEALPAGINLSWVPEAAYVLPADGQSGSATT